MSPPSCPQPVHQERAPDTEPQPELASEVEQLRAEVARERTARLVAEGMVEGYRQAFEQLLAARPAPSPCVAPAMSPTTVPLSPGDASPSVPLFRGDMKGGRGDAATAEDRRRLRDKLKKRRKRAKQTSSAVAEDAREASPCPPLSPVPLSPGDASPSVPYPPVVATLPVVRAPMASAARRARPAWMEDTTPGPEVAFFVRCQDKRLRVFPKALPETPPPGWSAWFSEALVVVGGDEARLDAAWAAYLGEEWARTRKPVCPMRAFMSPEVWRRHVPDQDVTSEPAAPSTPATAAEARRRATLEVGRGEAPPDVECSTGCGGRCFTVAWEHPVCGHCFCRMEAEVPTWSAESIGEWVTRQRQQPGGT